MNVRVQLFAVARQIVGSQAATLELTDGATVADLRRALVAQTPGLAAVADHLRFAVNNRYAEETAVIPLGAEVACIPPVSGG